MFKRVLILVLFILFISCKQNPSTILSAPPTDDNETIDGDNSNGGNTDNGNTDGSTDSGLGYGYYNVSILGNNGTNEIIPLRISDTYKMLDIYSNMIIDSATGEAKFKLHKISTSQTAEGDPYYTFNTNNLNIMKIETSKDGSKNTDGSETVKETIAKKFRGVCLVRIYPDAAEKPTHSPLLGDYTIAGVYTEVIPPSYKLISFMAMTNSDKFQNYGYDELIILRPDKPTDATASSQNTNYRADILFNINKSINLYFYNPNRTFESQNTNYIFERIVKSATE